MRSLKMKFVNLIIVALLTTLLVNSCETGVEDSPQPGIIRVTLQSNPSDTMLVEKSDTFYSTQKYAATFWMKISQGRIYRDSNFAIIYPTRFDYRQRDSIYNVLKVDSLKRYIQYTIFESYVPPFNFNKLEFGITPQRDSLMVVISNTGKRFNNFVELPPGENLLISLPVDFEVKEGRVTQIDVQINPFKSVQRYRDLYRFYRENNVKIAKVSYQ
ncbi:MAG: hypothetical protein N3A61_02610 [Ignavibacteria bacterium]|nr:hypothetical protein [Ignavibacteria bacterium]